MSGRLPPHLTRRRLSELIGVERATLSMWAKRHPDFPVVVRTGEGEAFDTAELLNWLGERRIPARSLRSFEEAGSTYRTRLERVLRQEGEDVGPAPARPAPAPDTGLRHVYDALRGQIEDSTLTLLLLLAISGSVDRSGEWQRLLEDPHPDMDDFKRLLPVEVANRLPVSGLHSKALRILLQAVDRITAEKGSAFAFDSVLARLAPSGGRRADPVPTTPAITELMARLIAPETATTVYEPACRAAELMVETARRSREGAVFLHGNARDPLSRVLSEANTKAKGMPAVVGRGEYPWTTVTDRHSRVVCNPPFSLRLPAHALPRQYEIPPGRADFVWLMHAVSALAAGGYAAVLMPRGTLFRRGKEEDLRAMLVEERVVEALILLPPHLAADASIPTVIWLLRPKGEAREDLLFVEASSLGTLTDRTTRTLSETDVSSIVEAVETWRATGAATGGLATAVSREAVRESDYLLQPGAYGESGRPPSEEAGAPDASVVLARLQAAEHAAERIDRDVADLLRRIRW